MKRRNFIALLGRTAAMSALRQPIARALSIFAHYARARGARRQQTAPPGPRCGCWPPSPISFLRILFDELRLAASAGARASRARRVGRYGVGEASPTARAPQH